MRTPEEEEVIFSALMEVVQAMRAYLPPGGITKDELISRVIEAVDNQNVAEAIA